MVFLAPANRRELLLHHQMSICAAVQLNSFLWAYRILKWQIFIVEFLSFFKCFYSVIGPILQFLLRWVPPLFYFLFTYNTQECINSCLALFIHSNNFVDLFFFSATFVPFPTIFVSFSAKHRGAILFSFSAVHFHVACVLSCNFFERLLHFHLTLRLELAWV